MSVRNHITVIKKDNAGEATASEKLEKIIEAELEIKDPENSDESIAANIIEEDSKKVKKNKKAKHAEKSENN